MGKWLRKLAPNVRVKVLLNKAEGMHDDASGSLMAAMGEAHSLGFGTPVAVSAESGQGLADLYEDLRPWVERAQEELLAKRAGSISSQNYCLRNPKPLSKHITFPSSGFYSAMCVK